MTEKEIGELIRDVLLELSITSTLQPSGTITSFIHLPVINAAFFTEILTGKEQGVIMISMQYSCPSEQYNEPGFQAKLKDINSQEPFQEDGQPWMRMAVTKKPSHLVVVAKIQLDKGGITRDRFRSKMLAIQTNTQLYWPLEEDD